MPQRDPYVYEFERDCPDRAGRSAKMAQIDVKSADQGRPVVFGCPLTPDARCLTPCLRLTPVKSVIN